MQFDERNVNITVKRFVILANCPQEQRPSRSGKTHHRDRWGGLFHDVESHASVTNDGKR